MNETLRVSVARAALLEIGRDDLAKTIGQNRIGDPKCVGGIRREDRTEADSRLIVRALRLGHQADPEGAPVGCPTPIGGMPLCDDCTCSRFAGS